MSGIKRFDILVLHTIHKDWPMAYEIEKLILCRADVKLGHVFRTRDVAGVVEEYNPALVITPSSRDNTDLLSMATDELQVMVCSSAEEVLRNLENFLKDKQEAQT